MSIIDQSARDFATDAIDRREHIERLPLTGLWSRAAMALSAGHWTDAAAYVREAQADELAEQKAEIEAEHAAEQGYERFLEDRGYDAARWDEQRETASDWAAWYGQDA